MIHLAVLGAAICLMISNAFAQDPLKVAPQAYQLELENEWVKVTRVHYAAQTKIPAHDHTETAAAYVYLNDSGPVIFKHVGASYGAVTRQPVKAGTFRLYKAVREVHEVENRNDTPSDFLRVEFKTEPVGALHGKYHREAYPAGENFAKVQFENEQIRVTRLVVAPGKSLDVAANLVGPAVLINLVPEGIENFCPPPPAPAKRGWACWLGAPPQQLHENRSSAPRELLRFEFKTKPIKPAPQDKAKPHAHPHN